MEKTCRTCRQKAANARHKERYRTDPDYRKRALAAVERNRLMHQSNRSPQWKARLDRTRRWRRSVAPERLANYNRKRHKKRWSDPGYRIGKLMSNKLHRCVKDKDYANWNELVGYSLQELVAHLEKQFAPGMTWENYGEWHVDHIRPLCSFDIKSKADPQFKDCWALSNLRPLWAADNLKKSVQDKLLKVDSRTGRR